MIACLCLFLSYEAKPRWGMSPLNRLYTAGKPTHLHRLYSVILMCLFLKWLPGILMAWTESLCSSIRTLPP